MFKSLTFIQDLRWSLIVILSIQGVIWRLCEIVSASSAVSFQHHWQDDKVILQGPGKYHFFLKENREGRKNTHDFMDQ